MIIKYLIRIIFIILIINPVAVLAQNYSQLAKEHIISNTTTFPENLKQENLLIVNQHKSKPSGLTHVYVNQMHNDIKIYNAISNIAFNSRGGVFYEKNKFIEHSSNERSNPTLTSVEAVNRVAEHFGQDSKNETTIKTAFNNKQSKTVLENNNIASTDITAELFYVNRIGTLVLVWSISYEKSDDHFWWDTKVDAVTGIIIEKTTWTVECNFANEDDGCDHSNHTHSLTSQTFSKNKIETDILVANDYKVVPFPNESPTHAGGSTSIVNAPWNNILDPAANPFTGFPGQSWHHDGTNTHFTTRGNNVWAVEDGDKDNMQSAGSSPSSQLAASQQYNYSTDFSVTPDNYQDAAITNLFYWNNLIHDVIYPYGFDEASGNFQETNVSNQGIGSDAVQADAQDGTGFNNANFGTPPEGSNPRMQMFVWKTANPWRDSDYDNGVIIHEYGHGISNRLTGGASSVGCLSNYEQMGEGWSDYFGLVLTMKAGDTKDQARGIGTYLLDQAISGPGIRPSPYSKNFGINNYTYQSTSSAAFPGELSIPHGVGFVWCTMLWDMTWDLIDIYGMGTNIYDNNISNIGTPENPGTFGGQNIALQLVIEALKLQPCNPGFVDGRDAILAADQALYNGVHKCVIWDAFARRGLGVNALQGSSDYISDNVENFESGLTIQKTVSPQFSSTNSTITFDIKVKGSPCATQTNVLAIDTLDSRFSIASIVCPSPATGNNSGNVITINRPNLAPDQQFTCQVIATVNTNIYSDPTIILTDDFESGIGSWNVYRFGYNEIAEPWRIVNTASNSPTNSWFVPNTEDGIRTRILESPIFNLTSSTTISFSHQFNTHSGFDGGFIQISTNNGDSWTRIPNSEFIQNGYNGLLAPSNNRLIPGEAWTGNSEGFIDTKLYLGSYAPSPNAKIRFVFGQNSFTGGEGWWIDDVKISKDEYLIIPTTACVTSDQSVTPSCEQLDLILELEEGLSQSPYNGVAFNIPGTIQAEEYDFGGQDIAYNDNMINEADDATGQIVRPGDFTDIIGAIGSEFSIVAWFWNGEWMEYTVDIEAGLYNIEVSTASLNSNPGNAVLTLDGEDLATIDIGTTASWANYQLFGVENILMPERTNGILQLKITGTAYNIDYIKFTKVSAVCSTQTITSQVNNTQHDSSEFSYDGNTGFNTYYSSSLSFSYIPSLNAQALSGIKFEGINVAQGAIISEAYIEFTSNRNHVGEVRIDITGEDVDNAVNFENTDFHISTRKQNNETDAIVTWMPEDWVSDETYKSADISNVIQELVNRDGFVSGNAIALFFEGDNTTNARRSALAFLSDTNTGPKLYLSVMNDSDGDGICDAFDSCPYGDDTVDGNGNGIPDACENICSQVDKVEQDAIEFSLNGNTGFNTNTSSNLVFSYIPAQSSQSISGIKFNNINVPQGAVILEAYIEFTAHQSKSDEIRLTISGEDVDNAADFENTDFHISTRQQNNETDAITYWMPVDWVSGEVYSTVNISEVIQEIVNRDGYVTGNAIALFLYGNDTNSYRSALTFSTENNKGPKLCLSFFMSTGDSDGDGVPNELDICPGGDDTIDENENEVPDACEEQCLDSLTETMNLQIITNKYASNFIMTNGVVSAGNVIEYKAGQLIELLPRFEVELGSGFILDIEDCSEVPNNNAEIRLYKIE